MRAMLATIKMKTMTMAVLTAVMLIMPHGVLAQEHTFDFSTAWGFAACHTAKASALTGRNNAEGISLVEHEKEAHATNKVKSSEKQLRKLYNCMNTINAILEGGSTALNTIGTAKQVSERMGKFVTLYMRFYNEFLRKGNIVVADTAIYTISKATVAAMGSEVSTLSASFLDLEQFLVTSKVLSMEMRASRFSEIINSINDSYGRIIDILDDGYFRLYEYMQLRSGFYKTAFYTRCVNSDDLMRTAFNNWKSACLKMLTGTWLESMVGHGYDYYRYGVIVGHNKYMLENEEFKKKLDRQLQICHQIHL